MEARVARKLKLFTCFREVLQATRKVRLSSEANYNAITADSDRRLVNKVLAVWRSKSSQRTERYIGCNTLERKCRSIFSDRIRHRKAQVLAEVKAYANDQTHQWTLMDSASQQWRQTKKRKCFEYLKTFLRGCVQRRKAFEKVCKVMRATESKLFFVQKLKLKLKKEKTLLPIVKLVNRVKSDQQPGK